MAFVLNNRVYVMFNHLFKSCIYNTIMTCYCRFNRLPCLCGIHLEQILIRLCPCGADMTSMWTLLLNLKLITLYFWSLIIADTCIFGPKKFCCKIWSLVKVFVTFFFVCVPSKWINCKNQRYSGIKNSHFTWNMDRNLTWSSPK